MKTDKRTDSELNRIIAEWCGWKLIPSRDIYLSGKFQAVPEEWQSPNDDYHDELPNYCRDLNAVHEAEIRLKGYDSYTDNSEYGRFRTHLQRETNWSRVISADARQHAEALVKLIEEGKK